MKDRKKTLREMVINILLGREHTEYRPQNLSALKTGVAEALARTSPPPAASFSFSRDPALNREDELLVHEIFWDLIIEKIITVGLDVPNPNFPWFRLHSEAERRLKNA
jgi:hypothetical protein